MRLGWWILCTVFCYFTIAAREHPTVELIRSAGYPVETHRTVTADGYLIVLHRIPRPQPARIVLYFHGLFGGSIDIVIRGPDSGLGSQVCVPKYVRRKHYCSGQTESCTTIGFCSWDASAQYDFPAIMDYVLSKTGAAKLSTIGLSMAGNIELGGLALHPRFNRRINVMVLFAPTARLKHIRSMIGRVAPYWRDFQKMMTDSKAYWFPFVDQRLFHRMMSRLCSLPSIGVVICTSIIFTAEGIMSEIDRDLIPRLSKYYPHPVPTKTIIHYLQIMNSGRFCPFDYGSKKENMKHYNKASPPDYDLSKVIAPTALFYSHYDTMATSKDVEWLASKLNNTVLAYAVPKQNFAHLSFMWDPNIKNLVYNKVIDLLLRNW